MDTAKVVQVIETTLRRRGDGVKTPVRVITQFWSLDGELLAEVDPHPDAPPRDPEIDDLRSRVLRMVEAIEWAKTQLTSPPAGQRGTDLEIATSLRRKAGLDNLP